MSRAILALLALTLVLGSVAAYVLMDKVWVEDDDRNKKTSQQAESLPEIVWDEIAALEVFEGDDSLRVERKTAADGQDQWVLPSKMGAPVIMQRLDQIKENLVGLEKSRAVGRNSSSHERFEVANPKGKRLKLFDRANNTVVDLLIGKQDLTGNRTYRNAGTYVRPLESDVVYSHRGRLASLIMARTTMWLDTMFSTIAGPKANELVSTATGLSVEYKDIPFSPVADPAAVSGEPMADPQTLRMRLEARDVEVTKEEAPPVLGPGTATDEPKTTTTLERKWFVIEPAESKDVDVTTTLVDNMVRMLMLGRFADVAGADPSDPKYGLDRPVMDVSATFADGTVRRLIVGNEVEVDPKDGAQGGQMKLRYAKHSDRPWVMTFNAVQASNWAKKPSDLVPPKPPEAPVAPPGGLLPDGPDNPDRKPIKLPDSGDPVKDDEKKEEGVMNSLEGAKDAVSEAGAKAVEGAKEILDATGKAIEEGAGSAVESAKKLLGGATEEGAAADLLEAAKQKAAEAEAAAKKLEGETPKVPAVDPAGEAKKLIESGKTPVPIK